MDDVLREIAPSMKVALVTYALNIGGVETFLKFLARSFKEFGNEVVFIETLAKGSWSQVFEDEGYEVIRVLSNPLRSRIYHAKRILEILRRYDAVILNDSPFAQAVLGALPEKTVGIPVLHMSLTSMVLNATANSRNWDVLSAVSPAVRQSALHFGIDATRVACIPNGIKVPEKWPKRDRDFEATKPFRLIYVGGINHNQKGVLHLPRVFKTVLNENVDFNLGVIGDGPDIGRLRDELKYECSSGKVVLHGALPNQQAMEILGRSDILIMPSHFEGLPLVLLEAMALGVVPVVSRLPGCTDFVVEDGVDGLLVETGDEIGFAKGLLSLANNRFLLKSMSISAWKTAKSNFSYQQTGKAYLEIVEICRNRRGNGEVPPRTGEIDKTLLGDLPWAPVITVRSFRKILRMLGLLPKPEAEPMLYNSDGNQKSLSSQLWNKLPIP